MQERERQAETDLLEVRQVELEQQVITLQSAQTQTTVQHNNTPLTRPGEMEVERDMSALWTVVRQLQQYKMQEQEKNRALEERIRLLEENLRTMTCDREQLIRELATPVYPKHSLHTTAEQSTPDPDRRVNITAEQTN